MDGANTPMSGLLSSLEAMIDASVSAALDRRLGPARDPLSVQVDAAVTSALDRRLGPAGVDLDNRIEVSVARAIRQRFGPLGSAISAQITLGTPQPPVRQCIKLSHTTVPQTAARASSLSTHRDQNPFRDLPQYIEFAKAQLDGSDDDDGDHAVNKMIIEHDLAALHERYTGDVGARVVQQQEGAKTFETRVPEENASSLQVEKELQMVEEHGMGDMLFAHSTSLAEKKTLPQEMILKNTVERLEASSTRRESKREHVSTAAQICVDRTSQSDYVRNIYSQGEKSENVEVVTENLLDDPDEAEGSLLVKAENLYHSISHYRKERKAGSIEETGNLLRKDEHSESLSKGPSIAAEDSITLREIITPNSAGALQVLAAKMAKREVTEAIPSAQHETDAPAGRPLSGKLSPPPKTPPPIDSAVVIRSSPGGNSVPMKEQDKSLPQELGEASNDKLPCLPEASRATALQKSSPRTNPGRAAFTEVEKRKASTLESAVEALIQSDEDDVFKQRKRAKVNPPGYTEGPPIRFLKVCSQLTARAKGRRGYPRVVDLESFTKHSNKQNFTMADVVTTVLWNHKPESLKAFLDFETYPNFSFVRKEGDEKRPSFTIKRKEEFDGTKVVVGYHARSPERSDQSWGYFKYYVGASGRWDPIQHRIHAVSFIVNKKKIQEAAVALGTEVFQREVWASEDGVEIEIRGEIGSMSVAGLTSEDDSNEEDY